MANLVLSDTLLVLVFTAILSSSGVDAAKIMIVTFQQPSHVIMKLGIATDLIDRGHEVHYVLAEKNPMVEAAERLGIHVITYQPPAEIIYPFSAEFEARLADVIFNRSSDEVDMINAGLHEDCAALLSDQQLIERIKSVNFDYMVIEPFIVNPCYLLIPHHFRLRFTVAVGVVIPFVWRLPALPSFYTFMTPGPHIVEYPVMKTFTERLTSTSAYAGIYALAKLHLWRNTSLLQQYAPEFDSWEEMMVKADVTLVENDHYLNPAIPLLPHVITIAGCTARPADPLPDNLEKIMEDSSEHGVIMASFGTSAYRMPAEIASKFLVAFGRLKQTVLTKMAAPAGFKVPDNVHLVKWQPQNDILGHPKTKLFITHGGSNSQYEALFHGVPMIVIPMFADQGWNCGRARHKDIALCHDLLTFTSDELYDSIVEVINNATYRTNIRRLSAIQRDEPLNGCQKAGFWIEHVIKYGGEHLRSPALDLSLFQLLMFDVIGFILFIVLIFAFAFVVLVRFVCRKKKHSGKEKMH